MIDDVTAPATPQSPVWRPDRPLRGWGAAVLGLSALWTGIVWVQLATGSPRPGHGPLSDPLQPMFSGTVVLTWLVTSHWLGRLHDLAVRLAPAQQRHSRFWASFGWVVPIVQLWFPKGVVDDVWKALERLPGRAPRQRTGWWWLGWIVAGFLTTPSVFSDRTGANQPVTLGFAVALTVALVLWARVVVGLTAAHDGPRPVVSADDHEEGR